MDIRWRESSASVKNQHTLERKQKISEKKKNDPHLKEVGRDGVPKEQTEEELEVEKSCNGRHLLLPPSVVTAVEDDQVVVCIQGEAWHLAQLQRCLGPISHLLQMSPWWSSTTQQRYFSLTGIQNNSRKHTAKNVNGSKRQTAKVIFHTVKISEGDWRMTW